MPAWSVVTSATLNVNVVAATNAGQVQVSLYPVIRRWYGDQVTWNNANDDLRWWIDSALQKIR